jgi:hypothetical protein
MRRPEAGGAVRSAEAAFSHRPRALCRRPWSGRARQRHRPDGCSYKGRTPGGGSSISSSTVSCVPPGGGHGSSLATGSLFPPLTIPSVSCGFSVSCRFSAITLSSCLSDAVPAFPKGQEWLTLDTFGGPMGGCRADCRIDRGTARGRGHRQRAPTEATPKDSIAPKSPLRPIAVRRGSRTCSTQA